jgi:hypothetical protein
MGEHYILAGDHPNAKKALNAAMRTEKPSVFWRGLVSMAWIDHAAGEHVAARAKLQKVLDNADNAPGARAWKGVATEDLRRMSDE